MISTTVFRRSAALLLGVSAFGVVPAVSSVPSVSAAPADCAAGSLCAGGEFFPVAPARIFDAPVEANGSVTVPVVDLAGVPADDVLAVAVNVTVAAAKGGGFASVAPADFDGSGDPTSLINFQYSGHTVPNFGIIGVGSTGELKIDLTTAGSGNSRVIVDVFGFVATSGFEGTADAPLVDGARMVTADPARIYDSRTDGAPLGTKESVEVPVRGVQNVPDSPDVTAVVVNLTGINNRPNSTGTYLTLTPDEVPSSASEAPSSNGNYPAGVVKANLAIVPINDDGSIYVYNRSGSTNFALDAVAYLQTGGDESSTTGRIVPLEAPFRSFDTRLDEFGKAKLGFSQWEDWSFDDFANSVRLNGAPIGDQSGLFGNLTAVGLERLYATQPVRSFLTMNPASNGDFPESPGNSNLNFAEGGAVANSAVVTYGDKDGDDNMVSAYNADGRTHYFLDVYAVILD